MILVTTIVYNATQSDVYLDVDNFVNLFRLSIEKVIIAVIMTFVIINGEIDLSVAAVMALAADLTREQQTLVDDGARRQRRHVEFG